MTEQAWFVYHSGWIVCYQNHGFSPDRIDVAHLARAVHGGIVFG